MNWKEFIKNNKGVCGIYAIVCVVNGMMYIGSSENAGRRIRAHASELRRHTHRNTKLQEDFNNFGQDSFDIKILQFVDDKESLEKLEYQHIEKYVNLYNKRNKNIEINLTEKEIQRFWSKVDRKSKNGCWNWLGGTNKGGYGTFKAGDKTYVASRVAFFLTNTATETNLIICHKCENKRCCAPHHLFAGTNRDNKQDALSKGVCCKITKKHVLAIRNRFAENPKIKAQELADWFEDKFKVKIDKRHIMGIARNVHWYDENYIPPDRVLDSGTRQKKLNWDIVHEIRDIALTKTKTSRDIWKYICSKYKIEICEQMVSDIIRNKYWRE